MRRVVNIVLSAGVCLLSPAYGQRFAQCDAYGNPIAAQGYATQYVTQAPTAYYQRAAVVVQAAPPYYYSVGKEISEKAIADDVMKQLQTLLEPAQANESVQANEPEAASPKLSREAFGILGGNSFKTSSGDNRAVVAAMQTNCIKCHKPGSAKPGVQLFTESKALFVSSDAAKEAERREKIYASIEDGSMPKDKKILDPDTKDLLLKYFAPQ